MIFFLVVELDPEELDYLQAWVNEQEDGSPLKAKLQEAINEAKDL